MIKHMQACIPGEGYSQKKMAGVYAHSPKPLTYPIYDQNG